MYESEAKFSAYLTQRLRKAGVFVQRIESGTTGHGIPDVWCAANGDDWFIELKNLRFSSVDDERWQIPWRPGQQAFAAEYKRTHVKRIGFYAIETKVTFTIAACKDGIIVIPMRKHFADNIVTKEDVIFINSKTNLIDVMEDNCKCILKT